MDQQQRFSATGLFATAGAVPPAALDWANQAVERFIDGQLAAERPARGVGVIERDGRRHLIGINALYANLGALHLYLMGLPAVVEAARAACGPEAVCTHDWMVVKNAGDGQRVQWHQDFVHDGRHAAINVGVHLDDAEEDAVRFVPGGRAGAEDICAIHERYDDHSPDLLSAPVAAGGITVHDVLLVHGSPPLRRQRRRKTLYLEFRDPAMLVGHPTVSPEYVEGRRELTALSRRLYRQWGPAPAVDPFAMLDEEERQRMDRLSGLRAGVEGAHYCIPGATP